jgi:DHA1 family bicyclomycin/chloramphenicol resistance-like MFS transporter
MMFIGNLIASIGMIVAILLFAAGFSHPASLFGPCISIGLGNGFTLPNSNAGIVSAKPELAGSASGLGGALQLGFGALLSFVAGFVLSPETGPYPLLLIMLCSTLAGLLATVLLMRRSRA